jgi:hypothetical protein
MFANAAGPDVLDLEGRLMIVWGDPPIGEGEAVAPLFWLATDSGEMVRLRLQPSLQPGDILAFNRQWVRVSGAWLLHSDLQQPTLRVDQISLAAAPEAPEVNGPQPWVSLMCKFADIPAEPENLAYFQNMYGSTYPGLDHYWRELSFDLINMNGADAVGWYVLPDPRSAYFDAYGNLLWGKAAVDCTGVADADVYFPDFVGINLMFNAVLDCCAWGGEWPLTLDGVTRNWYVTWEPPWGYQNIAVIEHEMGHGFGLPHSSGDYGQVYDNYWDVMSNPWDNNLFDPTYGIVGQHTISYHKDILDWIDITEKFVAPQDSLTTISLEQLALPQTTNYKMAQIPIGGSSTHFYTVEARRLVGNDAGLPGNAVIIHEVITSRQEPAHVIDIDKNGNTGDDGAMWTVGETFIDIGNQISVSVDSALPTGYVVTIQLGTPSGPPGAFDKLSPVDGAADQPLDLTLTWKSSALATSYEYCYDTSDDDACSNWISTGTATLADLSDLSEGTDYYWQVRALNGEGTTYANGSETAFWSFTTEILPPPPAEFDKVSPADGASDQPFDLVLSWASSSGAESYEYCYDTSGDNACSTWISIGGSISATLSGLDEGTDYYWQVRAVNRGGTTYANGSETAFWSFTTEVLPPPAEFDKVSPADGASDQPLDLVLSWASSSGAESYEYCYDTSGDDACSTWISVGGSISATLSGLDEGTDYYWQVRAVNAGGTTYAGGDSSAFWVFTTEPEEHFVFLPVVSQE